MPFDNVVELMCYQAAVDTKQANITPQQRERFFKAFAAAENEQDKDKREALLLEAAEASPETWASIGSSLLSKKEKRQAFAYFREALRFVPVHKPQVRAVILNNIGTLFSEFGERDAAAKCFLEANELWPGVALIEGNIALLHKWQNDMQRALHWINRTIQHADKRAMEQAIFTKSLILLGMGRLQEGWAIYDSRFTNPMSRVAKAKVDKPEWCGQDLTGKYIFLYAEQGHGDVFQFIRYAKFIKEKWPSCRVCFGAQIGQKRLLQTLPYLDCVIGVTEKIPNTASLDYVLPLLSCPRVMETNRVEDIRWPGPYIPMPEPLTLNGTGLKAGICWAGSVDHGQDYYRSTSLDLWEPILSVSGVSFYSLVAGPKSLDAIGDSRINQDFKPSDWVDTARMIAALDLVVSVDTGPVHLAAAMGKPVWMLTQFCPDFRWLLNREDSPWYPTLRLFRQERELEWEPVIERIAQTLRHTSYPEDVAPSDMPVH